MTHQINNHEASLLFSLRSRTTKEFKANFPYNTNRLCPMGCKEEDTPEHCLDCTQLKLEETNVQDLLYEDIFSDNLSKQVAVVQLISSLLEKREDASASTGPGCSPQEGSNNSHTLSV